MNKLFFLLSFLGGNTFGKIVFRIHSMFTASFGWLFLYIITTAYNSPMPMYIFYMGLPISLYAVFLFSGNAWDKNIPTEQMADGMGGLLQSLVSDFKKVNK